MTYLQSVWDLVNQKQYDKAWAQANTALANIASQISLQGWQQDAYKQKAELMGVDWAKSDFLADMTTEVGSILYAMGTICYKEEKYGNSYTYIYASSLLQWDSSGVTLLLKKLDKKVPHKTIYNIDAEKIANSWGKLGVGHS